MKLHIKKTVMAAVIVIVGAMPSIANAGGTESLVNVLVDEGILTKDEAKVITEDKSHKLKMSATIFADYTLSNTKQSGNGWANTGTVKKQRGVNLTRAYLTGRYYLNDTWMMRLTTDFSAEPTLGKQNSIYVKYAFAQGSFSPALRVRFGIIQNPWIPYVQDHLWAHRYVSKIMPDRLGLESSADAGIGLAGKGLGGMVRYQMAVLNGAGYNNTRSSNGMDESLRLELRPFAGLIAELGYRTGYRGQKKFNNGSTTYGGKIYGGKQNMWHVMVTYGSGHHYRAGINYLEDRDKAKQYFKTAAYGVWGWINLIGTSVGKFGFLGRYENIKQTPYNNFGSLASTHMKRERELIGIEFTPNQGPVFTLAYNTEKFSNILTDAGTAGAGTTGKNKRVNEVSLFAKYHF